MTENIAQQIFDIIQEKLIFEPYDSVTERAIEDAIREKVGDPKSFFKLLQMRDNGQVEFEVEALGHKFDGRVKPNGEAELSGRLF